MDEDIPIEIRIFANFVQTIDFQLSQFSKGWIGTSYILFNYAGFNGRIRVKLL